MSLPSASCCCCCCCCCPEANEDVSSRRNRDACLAAVLAASLLAAAAGASLWVLGSSRCSTPEIGVGIALTTVGCLLGGTAASLLIGARCRSRQRLEDAGGDDNGGCWLRRRFLRKSTGRVGDLAENGGAGDADRSRNGGGRVRILVTRSRSEERLDQSIEAAILRLHLSRPRKSSLKVSIAGSESPLSGGSGDIAQHKHQHHQHQRNHVRFSDSDDTSPTGDMQTSRRPSTEASGDNDSVFIIEADGSLTSSEAPLAAAPAAEASVVSEVERMEISAEELLRRSRTVDAATPSSTLSADERPAKRKEGRKKRRRQRRDKAKEPEVDSRGSGLDTESC